MKSYSNLYENMLDLELIRKCILDACKNKRTKRRSDVRYVKRHLDEESRKVLEMLENGTYEPDVKKPCLIYEPSCNKQREIIKPSFRYDQIIQHVLMSQLEPIIMRGMYAHSCASIPGRGDSAAKKTLERWIRGYNGKKFYVLKMDIKKFFPSIDKRILKRKLRIIINDERFLTLAEKVIDSGAEEGLPIGFYTSQWLANWYLQDLDYFIKQDLGAKHYVRYMDDMVILGRNKKELHRMRREIEGFLNERLHLTLKENWQVFRFVYTDKKTGKEKGRFIDFVGFKFYHNRTTLRKSTLGRISRKARRLSKKDRITWYDACQMNAGYSRMARAQTYHYYERNIKGVAPTKRRCRKSISRHFKKESKKR